MANLELMQKPFAAPRTCALQGAAENAAVLSNLVGGQEVVNDLFAYMSFLGIQGMGLVEATERSPIVGHIIGKTHLILQRHL